MSKSIFDNDIFSTSIGINDNDLIDVDVPEQPAPKEEIDLEVEEKKIEPKVKVKEEVEEEDLIEVDETPSIIEDKKEEEESKNIKKDTKNNKASSLSISPYAKMLNEKGILPSLDVEAFSKLGEDEQIEALAKAQEDAIDDKVDNFINQLPDTLKNILNNYFEGVPLEDLFKAESTKLQYSDIKEEDLLKDESLMKKLIIEDKMAKGVSLEDAKEEVDDLVSLDKFAVKALKSLKSSQDKEIEKKKVNIQQEETRVREENDKIYKSINKRIDDSNEFIKGLPLTSNIKNKVKDILFKPIGKDKQGNPVFDMLEERAKDPQGFDLRMAYLYALTNKFTDSSKLTTAAKTKASSDLVEQLRSQGTNVEGTGAVNFSNKSEVQDGLRALRHILRKD